MWRTVEEIKGACSKYSTKDLFHNNTRNVTMTTTHPWMISTGGHHHAILQFNERLRDTAAQMPDLKPAAQPAGSCLLLMEEHIERFGENVFWQRY